MIATQTSYSKKIKVTDTITTNKNHPQIIIDRTQKCHLRIFQHESWKDPQTITGEIMPYWHKPKCGQEPKGNTTYDIQPHK